jgi:hypothetical protein
LLARWGDFSYYYASSNAIQGSFTEVSVGKHKKIERRKELDRRRRRREKRLKMKAKELGAAAAKKPAK